MYEQIKSENFPKQQNINVVVNKISNYLSTQISRNSLKNTISPVYFRNIHMDNQNLKEYYKSLGTNLSKFILRPSYLEANSLPVSTGLILSVTSL